VPFWSPTFSVTEERSAELDAEADAPVLAEPAGEEDDDEQPAAASPARAIVRAA
jgi:hypothetical protein